MPDEELHLMIFEAGFSTAAQVTEFSGRGVGMSMVKETIEQQQGKIRIHSEKGKGSRFSLEIPIPKSVLITNCLFVSACEMTFGIPQEFVIRVLDQNALGQKGVESLGGSRFIRFEGDLVPVISLSDTLELNKQDQESFLVVLDTHGQVFALEVGQVMDTEDAVIKPLTINALKSLSVYQGGTFLGDGTVGLIMDIPGLAEKLCIKKKSVKTQAPALVDHHHLENIISFTLNSPGCFAIAEKDVFRVEVLQTRHMVMSGEQLVMPYRESMMTMVDLESVLFGKMPNLNAQELAPALIVKSGDQYLGLLVQEIRDLEAVKMEVIAPLRKKMGLEGHVLHQGLTFSLLSLGELKQLFSEPRASITAGMNQVA
jgi:two-component system chemotaxis sensor kinase CheA